MMVDHFIYLFIYLFDVCISTQPVSHASVELFLKL